MNHFFPEKFEERMRGTLRSEWEAFDEAHRENPPVSARINPAKTKLPDMPRVPWTDFGYYLDSRPSFTLDPVFHAGAYYVQEASSMFLEQAVRQSVDLSQSLRVLDLCAAPGGKSTHLLSLISRDSLLVSNEVIRTRATILSENIQKWGFPNVVVSCNDPEDFQQVSGFFDLVVVDAPCSGEGLFRKEPAAMTEWSTAAVDQCSQRQRRILADVWPSLKKDGVLIYCTCTFNELENEENLNWLCQQKNCESIPLKIDDAWGVQSQQKGHITGYRCFPHRLKGEGFFISALKKKDEAPPARIKSKVSFTMPSGKTTGRLKEWLIDPSRFQFISQDDLILMVPARHVQEIAWLSERLKVFNKGTALATLKHEKLVPEHAAALSTELQRAFFPVEELSRDSALSYLRKDALLLDESKRGFALVTHDSLPLGWVNLLGNRVNNLYPSSWRIRMGS